MYVCMGGMDTYQGISVKTSCMKTTDTIYIHLYECAFSKFVSVGMNTGMYSV